MLDVERYPQATFVSSSVASMPDGQLRIFGELTCHGISRKIEWKGRKIGEMNDEWGRHRVGFEAATVLNTLDFDMAFPPSHQVMMELYLEGVQKPSKKATK